MSWWKAAVKRFTFPCVFFAESPPPAALKSNAANAEAAVADAGRSCPAAVSKSLCAICLDSLSDGPGVGEEQRIYTAQCTHSFHFLCIASNLRHGNYTCPICRSYWSHLPHNLITFTRPSCQDSDPILRILDDSIASSRVNRRSSIRSATRYDDDDPVVDATAPSHPRLHLALSRAILSVKLSHQQPSDVVLVVSPNGPHLRLLKQSMAVVVFSLRAIDRLAIVTCSTTASRALPLRRMTSDGKRLALHVIDRIFYVGDTDPTEGIKKGVKILEDRMHHNPLSCIIHISDNPTQGYVIETPATIHRFYVWNGLVMHEFENFLLRLLGGALREIQLRIGEERELVRLGELRVGEERKVSVDLMGGSGYLCIGYRYIEGAGVEERLATGEVAVGIGDKTEGTEDGWCEDGGTRSSSSSIERWDYLDPFMARRRWAKRLHGNKI